MMEILIQCGHFTLCSNQTLTQILWFTSSLIWSSLTSQVPKLKCQLPFAPPSVFQPYYCSHTLLSVILWYSNTILQKDKLFCCLSIVRILFGLFSGLLGLWLVTFDDKLRKDIVNTSSTSIFIGTYVSMGFFIMDGIVVFGSIIVTWKVDYGLVIHHILSSLSIISIVYYEKGLFFLAVGLLCEIVEPFDCFSWMLQKE